MPRLRSQLKRSVTSQRSDGINQQITEQSDQIAHAIDEVSRAANEEQYAAIEEIAAASEALARLAEDLQTSIDTFKIRQAEAVPPSHNNDAFAGFIDDSTSEVGKPLFI